MDESVNGESDGGGGGGGEDGVSVSESGGRDGREPHLLIQKIPR